MLKRNVDGDDFEGLEGTGNLKSGYSRYSRFNDENSKRIFTHKSHRPMRRVMLPYMN